MATSGGTHGSHALAVAAERRWAIVVGLIIAALIAMMVFTGLQWAAMPPSRVETIDPRTLHVSGEFIESNLGTSLGADGKVVVRVDVPVTFRGTSSDVIHGFVVGRTNANAMLIPGFVATFTTTFHKTGEQLMPCHEYCGTGHEAMWARVQVIPANDFLAKAAQGKRVSCVSR
jgi:cytochrome c oxidase subunit 2